MTTDSAPSPEQRSWIRSYLAAPYSAYTLAAFRIVFGVAMAVEMVRYFPQLGWLFIDPTMHFYYEGFSFIQPWGETGVYIHAGIIALSAAGIALGLFYRVSAIVFFVM